jgi:Circularly permutated YpsA SLOG family
MKIVSGAQTGVDRAALDAAIETGIEAGGWCPEGRIAEDGIIPEIYPVKELPNSGYRQRTKRNVIDSDGTVIFYFAYPSGGTEQTIAFCIKEKKPYVLIDAEELLTERAAIKIEAFIRLNSICVLNVAGPRAGGEPRAYEYAKEVIQSVLQNYS